MKNCFLYMGNDISQIGIDYKEIYCFKNRILAINRNAYDRQNRLELQRNLNILPYYVTQNIFINIFKYAIHNKQNLRIVDIEFVDKSIEDTLEFEYLNELIQTQNMDELFNCVQEILQEFDTDIDKITLLYKGYEFFITKEGILDTYATEEVLFDFFSNEEINKLFLGINVN